MYGSSLSGHRYEDNVTVNPSYNLNGPYMVERVKDGDTIVCKIDGENITVRLIGIDTPESVHPDEEKNCEEGKLASDHTKELLDGKQVFLEYDEELYDRYDRTLAYVYLDGIMINKKLLEEGYAKTEIIEPNIKYVEEFKRAEEKVAEENKGFWNGYFE